MNRPSTYADAGCLAGLVLAILCALFGAYTCVKTLDPATTNQTASPASRTEAVPTPRSSPAPVEPISSDSSFIVRTSSPAITSASFASSPATAKSKSTRRLSALSGPRWKVCNDQRTGRLGFTQNDCAAEIVQKSYMCAAVQGFPHCEPPATMDLGAFGIASFGGDQVRKGYPEWIWNRDGVVVAYTPKVFTQAAIDTLNGGAQ